MGELCIQLQCIPACSCVCGLRSLNCMCTDCSRTFNFAVLCGLGGGHIFEHCWSLMPLLNVVFVDAGMWPMRHLEQSRLSCSCWSSWVGSAILSHGQKGMLPANRSALNSSSVLWPNTEMQLWLTGHITHLSVSMNSWISNPGFFMLDNMPVLKGQI